MSNLLKETKEILKANGLKMTDVEWIGTASGKNFIPLKDFEREANREYDSGFGSNEVARDLVIVGKDWWLERGEYDGSEWWEFKRIPTLRKGCKELEASRIFPKELFGRIDEDEEL